VSSLPELTLWLLLATGLGASVALGLSAPWLARSMPPGLAGPVLASGSAICAGCTLVSLALLTVSGLGTLSLAAHLGRWSTVVMAAAHPPPFWAGCAAGLLLLVLVDGRAMERGSLRASAVARRAGRARPGRCAALVVLPDRAPFAYAVAGVTRGQVAVSTGLLGLLDDAERAAVLAHEQAHLVGRHHLLRAVTVLAARADPLLCGLPPLVHLATERAADESAARSVGDRSVVARALCRAALGAHRPEAWPAPAGFAHDAVGVRVRSLLEPPPTRRWPVLALALLLVGTVVATSLAAHGVHGLFDHARDALEATRR